MRSELKITIAQKGGKSILEDRYFTPPFKIIALPHLPGSSRLELMLMSASPGMLNKDRWNIQINAGSHTDCRLSTQSYQRLFPAPDGTFQHMEINLSSNAQFEYLPHPLVPHQAANFKGYNNIFLSAGNRFIFGEVITPGRQLNGETFQFERLQNCTQVYLHQQLIFKDNQILIPGKIPMSATGQYENYTHQGTFLYFDTSASPQLPIEACYKYLQQGKLEFGISESSKNGMVARILGHSAESLFRVLQELSSITKLKTTAI